MKLTAILLLCFALQASSKGFSQKVNLNVKNAPLTSVFEELRKQTGVSFMWDEKTIRMSQPVTIRITAGTLQDALTAIMKSQPLSYSIIDNMVLIRVRKDKEKTELLMLQPVPIVPDSIVVKGRVQNQNGEPLGGVTIAVKGKSTISLSNDDGTYAITAGSNDVLVFTYTGLATKEERIGRRNLINISMQIAANDLNEIVVVGYGSRRKKDLVGSVTTASSKDFGDVATSNGSQLIQGKMAGVQVLDNGGRPGAGSSIVVRGTGSFTSTEPLYVIDGIQSNETVFNSISPYDIQDITVLKDAASVAIYGAQGANGVVIITTRRPRNKRPQVSYDAYAGVSSPWKKFKLMNAAEYVSIVKEWYLMNPESPVPSNINDPASLITRTDWQDAMFRTGKLQEHHLNVGGSSETMNYTVSAGYTKQAGQVVGSDFQRMNLRVNLEEKVGKRFKFGQQLSMRYRLTRGTPANISEGLRMPPYIGLYDPNNPESHGYGIATSQKDGNDAQNPLIGPSIRDVRDRGMNSYLQLFGEVQLLTGLKFRSQIGVSFDFDQYYNFNPTYRANQLLTATQTSESYSYNLGYIFENYFNYDKTFGQHAFNLTAGMSYKDDGLYRSVELTGSDFPNDDIHQIGGAINAAIKLARANSTERFISYFGRLNYTFNDKYILSVTTRRDATSLFAPDHRVGYFPSVGVAWRLSDEKFMRNLSFISELKLRGSYGKTGNSKIDGFAYQSNVWKGSSNSIVYPFGKSKDLLTGATIAIPPSPDLQWETTYSTDIGIDATFFDNKFSLSLGYYNRDNRDLLVRVPIPYSRGYGGVSGAPTEELINAASVYNKGVEATVGYADRRGDFNWNISLNAAYNENKVTTLGTQGAVPIQRGEFFDVPTSTYTGQGYPIGSYYGYVYDHVAIDQADIDKYNEYARKTTGDNAAVYQSGLLPGDRIFKDVNGDGVVDEKDKTVIGNPIPKWSFGGNINLGWKNFDLMIGLQGLAGVDLINGLNFYMQGFPLPFNGKTEILKRWQKPGDVTDIPKIGQNRLYNTDRMHSWYVEDGSYLRVRNITLGYTFSQDLLRTLTRNALSSLRVYVTAQNLFTFTGYSGFDPEVGGGILDRGVDRAGYPHSRSFQLGLRLAF
ncbi:TonB-dependent receptor [Pseudoflavitalea sp. G-6-1-2]|uniref:SusC/RagA family TonB-linked outer membrane protein n=1 Tax=Pseudoflavitalea sp. G-6-1-2 TaxID=2728841 RepID=UPI00146A2138|nr:TonB-dependent receptor [Pseudoflavitalea sp. G-6-1-2]NML23118.1 TonB-dependent receptor [Pseudoflavitalea sp. G-6-1-2]